MVSPKFSIIIPVYNVAPYLRECLDSVLAQTFTDWEAICVDDGSTDGSDAILDEYAEKDVRFHVIHQANAGVSAARNAALDVAQGEWILFVDSDDSITKGCFEKFLALSVKADVNFFNTTFVYGSGLRRTCSLDLKGVVSGGDDIANFARYLYRNETQVNLLGYTWNKFFRAEVIRKGRIRFEVGLSCAEDEVFTLQVLSKAKNVRAFSSECYVYRCSCAGLTGKWLFDADRLIGAFERVAKGTDNSALRNFVLMRICIICRTDFVLHGSLCRARMFLRYYRLVAPMLKGRFAVLWRCVSWVPEFLLVVFVWGLRLIGRAPAISFETNWSQDDQ